MTSPLDRVDWPVRTARLTLRPAGPADAEATWAIRSQESVHRWITSAPGALEDYRVTFVDPDRLRRTLVVELVDEDGTAVVVGDLYLAIEDAWAQSEVREAARATQAELGWCLDPAHQGQGYAAEAVRALISLCLGPMGLRRVTAVCFAANEASWRLMQRIGMRLEVQSVRDCLHRDGTWHDSLAYAVLAEEWPARQPAQVPQKVW